MAKLSFAKLTPTGGKAIPAGKTITMQVAPPAPAPEPAPTAAEPAPAPVAEAQASAPAATAPTAPATEAATDVRPAPTASATAFAKLVSGPSPAPAVVVAGPASVPTAQAVVPYKVLGVPAPVINAQTNWVRDDNNITMQDIILPRVNIVQKTGELSNLFAPGTILLDKEIPIGNEEVPARIVVVGFRPIQYVERVENTTILGRMCDTPEEVEQMGGTIDWNIHNTTGQPIFQKMATAMVVVARPDGCEDTDHFPHELEGQHFQVAMWSLKGTGFTHAAKPIFTARRFGALKGGYISRWISVTTLLKQYNKNFAYVPIVKIGDETPGYLRDLALAVLN